jgi:hypothetical protein
MLLNKLLLFNTLQTFCVTALSLVLPAVLLGQTTAAAQNSVLRYLELREIGSTPAEVILSTDYQTIIEFEDLSVDKASSGRADQVTVEIDEQTIRLRANQEFVSTDLTVKVGGETALFVLRSDPDATAPRRYVVRNSPPPALASIAYQGIEGKTDPNALSIGTKELPPGVTLDLTASYATKGSVALQYILENNGEVPIVNEPSRLNILHEDSKLRYTLSRVPPAGSANVIAPGEAEYGTIIVPSPPSERLSFLWVLVQLGPGGHYAVTRDVSVLLGSSAATSRLALPLTAVTTETSPTTPALPPNNTPSPATAPLITEAPAPQNSPAVPEISAAEVSPPQATPLVTPKQTSRGSVSQTTQQIQQSQTTPSAPPATGANTSVVATNLIANPEFEDSLDPWYLYTKTDKGTAAEGTLTDDGYCVTVTNGGQKPYHVSVGQILELKTGSSYTLSFEVKADQVTPLVIVSEEEAEPYTKYLREDLTADAGKQTFEYTFTMPGENAATRLGFLLGGTEIPTPATVCLDNVQLKENAPTLESAKTAKEVTENVTSDNAANLTDNLLSNPSFDEGDKDWQGILGEGARGIAKVTNGEYCFNMLSGGTNTWSTRLDQGGFVLEPNQSYLLSFDAYAPEARTIMAKVGQNYEPWSGYKEQSFILSEDKKNYTLAFVTPAFDNGKSMVELWLGGELASNPPVQACFDNITLKKATQTISTKDSTAEPAQQSSQAGQPAQVASTTVSDTLAVQKSSGAGTTLLETTFDNDAQDWAFWFVQNVGALAEGTVSEGKYCIMVEASGRKSWGIQVESPRELSLEEGHSYQLSFDAKASNASGLRVRIARNVDPAKHYLDEELAIDTTEQTFNYTLTMPENNDNLSVGFMVGGELSSNAPTNICFDNIILKDVTQTTLPGTPSKQTAETDNSSKGQTL